MKTLYLIRHAKSSWEYNLPDEERPLNERGENDAKLMGQFLSDIDKPIDLVRSSPANRALTTAKIVTEYLGISEEDIIITEDLYDFQGYQVLDCIKNTDDKVNYLLIFGHNHAFTSLCNTLGDKQIDNLPTAGFVEIQFDVDHWKDIKVGKNLLSIFPKALKK
ncbi:SixA phosphatase family protein [Aquimarina brevivitae]|uniref:Phosphohistidine phosphatase n=1 Tax=Aquimarina brevivitae TaxID=323412 RepID=A0A4Q7P1L8_9FLAO|nr:histidine phosphatase family protein [Aquimarina brevivitae]RZS93741.1 phosphohistidine phosphatase [Aquimarina brevivitae]